MCRRSKVSALTKLTLCSRATQWPNRILPIYKFSENIFAIVRIRNVFHWLYSLALRPLKTYTNCRCSIWIQPTVWIMQYCFFYRRCDDDSLCTFCCSFTHKKLFTLRNSRRRYQFLHTANFERILRCCVFFSLSLSIAHCYFTKFIDVFVWPFSFSLIIVSSLIPLNSHTKYQFLIYSMMYRPPKIILKMKRIQYGRIGYERIHTFNWMHKITEYFLLTHQSRGQKNYDYLAITFVSVPHNQTTLHTQYVFMTTVWEESYEWREDILTQRTAHDWHGKITMQTEANEQSLSHANAFRYIKIY